MSIIYLVDQLDQELDRLFRASEAAWPEGAQTRSRVVTAAGTSFRLSFMPWRASRRLPGGATVVGPDVGKRILFQESLYSCGTLRVTPNRFPLAARHLLLWEPRLRRVPSVTLMGLLVRLTLMRPELLGFVNSIGAAATIHRAHAHLLEEPEPLALDGLPLCWEQGPACQMGFLEAGAEWPALVVAFRGEQSKIAKAVKMLLALRWDPAFNLIVRRGTLWFVFRQAERVPEAYPLPIGALELAGSFIFEDETSYLAMTGESCLAALAGATHRPCEASAQAVREALRNPLA